MKRLAALLAASLLLAGCTAAHKAVQVPEYPWDTTQQAVQQACPDAVAEDNSVLIETGALFGVPAQGIRLTYDGGRPAGVAATVQAQDRDALLASMQKALGAPAESYTPAMQNALSSGFRVYLSNEMVLPDVTYYWHTPQPLAETWTQEEQDAWTAAMREHYDWENHEPTAGTVNGVEKEIYHADEAAKVYLENNYEAVVSYQGQEGSDRLLIATRLLPPQPASAPAA